jgi:serine/threonine-protein kinase RsbW
VSEKKRKSSCETFSLTLPSLPQYLRLARCFVVELAEAAGFALKDRDRICLAVGEACSNIIRHSYKGSPDGIIILKCELHGNGIRISIRDFGEKMDLSQVRPPAAGAVQCGGLGLHIIKCVMDEVKFETTHEGGNEIHMIKYFPPRKELDGS